MRDNREIAIQVENVNKLYKLYDKPSDRLKEALGLSRKQLYHEHYALHDINMTVHKGECVGIIGTNGAGKSTILKIITGVLNPTEGSVTVNGRISALLELGAGFNMEYTGIENVYINGIMCGFSREEIDLRLNDILEFAGIGDFVYQPVKTYSSGMFVRLAFAVAINIEPEILIVDEALSVGDIFFQAKCFRKFEEFKKKGKTILFVSHALDTIQRYCDRAILLNKGQKLAEGKAKQIIDMYNKILVTQKLGEDSEAAFSEEETEDTRGKKAAPAADTKKAVEQEWKIRMNVNPSVVEYGTKEAEIVDFCIMNEEGVITNTLDKGTYYYVRMKVRFHKKIQEPVLAFTIKDLKGVELTGTNTLLEDVSLPENDDGKEIAVQFRQQMLLRGNEYLLSLGCTGYQDGEFQVYHRLYDICNISVLSRKDNVGLFATDSDVEIL